MSYRPVPLALILSGQPQAPCYPGVVCRPYSEHPIYWIISDKLYLANAEISARKHQIQPVRERRERIG